MRPAHHALIVIDVQNDFCPGGALQVAGGDEIISRINGLMDDYGAVVLTQDWHHREPSVNPFAQLYNLLIVNQLHKPVMG